VSRSVLLLALVAILGCSRASGTADGGADAAVAATPSVSAATSASGPASSSASEPPSAALAPRRREVSGAAGSGLEARRSVVTHIEADPVLSANAAALRKQHGGTLPASLAVQATDLGADHRRAVLVGADRSDGTLDSPMLFVLDEHGTLLWSKDRPAAGIKPPVGALAIAAGPHGRFALAACDSPTSSVALRLWDEDGSPFADFQALETKACDAITLLYWPGHGWLLAIAAGPDTRLQLVTDTGGLAWGPGRLLGARFRTIAPASLASDSTSSFVLVQYSQSPGEDRDVDHAVAYRYDDNGQPLWAAPVDLGPVRRITPGQERITLGRTNGVLRASLASGTTFEIRSNGETRRVP
jgi:hypothetical protein